MTTAKRRIPINGQDTSGAGDRHRDAGEDRQPKGKRKQAAPVEAAEFKVPLAEGEAAAVGADASVAGEAEPDGVTAERDMAAERDALADSLLRLRADFENFRKRSSRELIDARVRAQAELLGDLLPVLDNLERALDAAEHHEEGKVLDGVRLTRDMFLELLVRAGVEEIEGVGMQFDPEVHEAMLMQPSDYGEGLVAEVVQRGYRQGERILRPARVVVSAGSAQTAKKGEAAATHGPRTSSGADGPAPSESGRTATSR